MSELYLDPGTDLWVREIRSSDIEFLRVAKNSSKDYFFLQKNISSGQQKSWFKDFSRDRDNYMYVIESANGILGSIGFRKLVEDVDFYNIMIWEPSLRGQGIMTRAFDTVVPLVSMLYPSVPLRVRVLTTNPAETWYLKRGFTEVSIESTLDGRSFKVMEFQPSKTGVI